MNQENVIIATGKQVHVLKYSQCGGMVFTMYTHVHSNPLITVGGD